MTGSRRTLYGGSRRAGTLSRPGHRGEYPQRSGPPVKYPPVRVSVAP